MNHNFQWALSLVLKSEVGWSDNPADPDGATMKGLTLANFRRYVKLDTAKANLKKITVSFFLRSWTRRLSSQAALGSGS